MSIASLCDHRAIVYRATELRDELQDAVASWSPLPPPAGKNCRPNQAWSGSLEDRGPGQQQAATRTWYLVPSFDVRERDVLSIVDGPEAPLLVRVLSVNRPTAPMDIHHLEVEVEVWNGSVTAPVSS